MDGGMSETRRDIGLDSRQPLAVSVPAASYTRSLLKIETPIVVALASTRMSVSKILELGPGSIIQFEKSCDEPLVLEVGGQPIAEGETVKVGEKFGLRLTAMILPSERFMPLSPLAAAR
jgi:flagellar motor switch/type III secretory pathway protein FliN